MSSLYRIKLSPSISPEWMDNYEFLSPILSGLVNTTLLPETEILATYQQGTSIPLPLITRTHGEVECLFDVKETIRVIRNEEYHGSHLSVPITGILPFDYTKLPVWFIGLMAKAMTTETKIANLPDFPRYPIDLSSDIFSYIDGRSGKQAFKWPGSKKYAVAFTHDIDTPWAFNNDNWLKKFVGAEEKNNITSSWYVVPLDIKSAKTKNWIGTLLNNGHEIGAHGYDHDPVLPNLPKGKLFAHLKSSHNIIETIAKSDEIGYRAPWLSRNNNLCEGLLNAGFLYDSSVPNCDFQRNNKNSNNGCCTVFPYMRCGIPVLPVTVPQDDIYGTLGISARVYWEWIFKLAEKIKKTGGVVVISTHLQPHHSANEPMFNGYKYLLEKLTADNDAWITLPKNIIKHFKKYESTPRTKALVEK